MDHILLLAFLWILLATLATIISYLFKISAAVSEILLGIIFGYLLTTLFDFNLLSKSDNWIQFIGTTGTIFLTFLAGLELHPSHLRKNWKETISIGLTSYLFPFLICAFSAYYVLHWNKSASLIAGIALSTTSVAVVYTVLLELNLNHSEYGKKLLTTCFVTDLMTVIFLSLFFTSFTYKTILFLLSTIILMIILPTIVKRLFKKYGENANEFETKFLLSCLFGMSFFALSVKLEPVLPAYLIGVSLAAFLGRKYDLIKRLRTLTFGLLTPFYFISVGLLVSISSIANAFLIIVLLLFLKLISKWLAIYPLSRFFKANKVESIYAVLLMSSGLTFGCIAALYGRSHQIINANQYSILVAVIIASAVFPTLCAYIFFKVNSRNKIALDK